MIYVGIDPGDVWCGVAIYEAGDAGDNYPRAEARTYHIPTRGGPADMALFLMDILPRARQPVSIIVEDFRIRASGHQRFSAGATLRLIGALEYGVRSISSFHWCGTVVAPGSSKNDNHLLFGRALKLYQQRWPHASNPSWDHCRSAWRVLGHYLLRTQAKQLALLHRRKTLRRIGRWLPTGYTSKHDMVAPAVLWR